MNRRKIKKTLNMFIKKIIKYIKEYNSNLDSVSLKNKLDILYIKTNKRLEELVCGEGRKSLTKDNFYDITISLTNDLRDKIYNMEDFIDDCLFALDFGATRAEYREWAENTF